MMDVEQKDGSEQNHSVADFNRLVSQYWEKPDAERHMIGARAEIDGILASMTDPDREAFLWESIRTQIIDGSRRAVEILASPHVSGVFKRISSLTAEQLAALPYNETQTLNWFDDRDKLRDGLVTVSLDLFDPRSSQQSSRSFDAYPYNNLQLLDNPDMSHLCANLGHDVNAIPAFSNFAMNLAVYAESNEAKRRQRDQIEPGNIGMGVRIFSGLHRGASWMFEAYANMAEGNFPEGNANLTEVLQTVADEAAARAFGNNRARALNYQNVTYRNPYLDDPKKTPISEFTIDIHIAPDLTIPGNESGLHLLFYQFVKNTVVMFQDENTRVDKPAVAITAARCTANGEPCIAVRMSDNGPGLDFAAILRSKQKLLQEDFDHLTDAEKKIAGDWTSLDLRLFDIVNFIFERRVSGSARAGMPHSGIGMTLAKGLVESHGGTIWGTNIAADIGAKFLILLDPSGNGSLRNAVPELYRTDTVPAQLLTDIDRQLTNTEKR
ncbi:MAG TPA: sensor histidine kinase [Patescibacteria group bacterium]|nr:sensor histidine kinase [Patescibacteria group bacterium]